MGGKVIAMRLDPALVRAVDGYAKQQTAETGVPHTRTDAVRRLLKLALEQLKNTKEKR